MISPLARSLATFMVYLAFSSLSGIGSYFLVRSIGKARFGWLVLFWVTYLLILAVTLGEYPWTFLLVLLCLPLCCIGAAAEKAARKLTDGWDTQMGYLFGACLLCIVLNTWIGVVALQVLVVPTGPVRAATLMEASSVGLGLLLGTVASPMAVSLFHWLLLASRLRPGVDRPLDPHEILPGPPKYSQSDL